MFDTIEVVVGEQQRRPRVDGMFLGKITVAVNDNDVDANPRRYEAEVHVYDNTDPHYLAEWTVRQTFEKMHAPFKMAPFEALYHAVFNAVEHIFAQTVARVDRLMELRRLVNRVSARAISDMNRKYPSENRTEENIHIMDQYVHRQVREALDAWTARVVAAAPRYKDVVAVECAALVKGVFDPAFIQKAYLQRRAVNKDAKLWTDNGILRRALDKQHSNLWTKETQKAMYGHHARIDAS